MHTYVLVCLRALWRIYVRFVANIDIKILGGGGGGWFSCTHYPSLTLNTSNYNSPFHAHFYFFCLRECCTPWHGFLLCDAFVEVVVYLKVDSLDASQKISHVARLPFSNDLHFLLDVQHNLLHESQIPISHNVTLKCKLSFLASWDFRLLQCWSNNP